MIDNELKVASAIETEIMDKRRNAAAKIYAYWIEKRTRIKEKSSAAGVQSPDNAKNNRKCGDLLVNLNYASKEFSIACKHIPALQVILSDADHLSKSMTFIVGSNIIKSSFELQFIL